MMKIVPIAAIALAAFTAVAMAQTKTGDSAKGKVLTDAKGMTLYTFDKDSGGTSNCYDACATKWPPLMAAADAKAEGKYTHTARKDGSMQWVYNGQPLYLWQNDKKPGDVTGDGVGGVWHVAKE
jgi:predicted lipoprotein with Yx(FWY)xxD motif